MTFIAFTDTHGSESDAELIVEKARLAQASFLMCAGDLSLFGTGYEGCVEILKKAGAPVYFVPGNHDEGIAVDLAHRYPWMVDIAGRVVAHGDAILIGIPSEDTTADWERMERTDWWPAAREALMNRNPGRVIVMVSHYPPMGCRLGDDRSEDNPCVPSELVETYQPDVFLFGHYHRCFNKEDRIGRTWLLNPGPTGRTISTHLQKFACGPMVKRHRSE